MRWNFGSLRSAFSLFAVFALLLTLPASSLLAEEGDFDNPVLQGTKHRNCCNHNLRGVYIAQSTGTTNFPPPLSDLNGPYAITGRMVADGHGNLSGFAIQIRNGMVMSMPFTGTYEVEEDGTVWATVTGETPLGQLSVEYYGILFDGGKQAKVTAVAVSIPGIPFPPGFVGMTTTGSFVRQ